MSENVIGKFCALGKKDTLVYPKNIPGYTSPEPQPLTEDKQQLKFIYTPIKYNIFYELDGGYYTIDNCPKDTFTVEDPEFIPPSPNKHDCVFTGWKIERVSSGEELKSVYGIGDVKVTATWRDNAILASGDVLHAHLKSLAGGDVNRIMAIQQSPSLIESDYMNLSCTSTPILARFDSGIVYIYCQYDIYCNEDMARAFKDFMILRDISALRNFTCKKDTIITELFAGCVLLSDLAPVEYWAEGQFKDYTDAFKGTAALSSGRVPGWYRWSVRINYMSSTGTILDTSERDLIPGDTIYPKSFSGYTDFTKSIEIDSPDKEYTFIYTPIEYKISYIVDSSLTSVPEAKETYTVEDVGYYPPDLYKEGYTFSGWAPECIHAGDQGDVTFIASFYKN